jgi:hypothetical protein
VTIPDADLQDLLNSLGLNLTNGLTNLDLQQILQALGASGAAAGPAG